MVDSSFRFLRPIVAIVCGCAGGVLSAAIEAAKVDFDYVRQIAEANAASPYEPLTDDLPGKLAAVSYDEYRDIRFNPAEAFWRDTDLPFQLQFFHRGGLFREKVTIHEFSATHEQVIPFSKDYFTYGRIGDPGWLRSSLGYAGFRVHTPMNRPDYYDEVIAFLGGSYFRAIGAQQIYGLSARGVALNSGLPGEVEEFPRFTDFWVGKPKSGDAALTIYALLQGPSVAGAYEFVVRPGKETTVDVRTELIFRKAVKLPGIAPLTSMFWYGENSARPAGQLRGEVHDSDGLLVEDASGARIWQPLKNPTALELTTISFSHLARFGLLQRDRHISSYEDLEAHYEQRPSAWIEPKSDWGEGFVRLVQLPAATETGDNIVAFWVPSATAIPRRVWQFSYRIVWSLGEPEGTKLARVAATREGELGNATGDRLFWVDFVGGNLPTDASTPPEAAIEVTGPAKVRHSSVIPYPQIGGWRVAIEMEPMPANKLANLHCQLKTRGQPISETWVYAWKS